MKALLLFFCLFSFVFSLLSFLFCLFSFASSSFAQYRMFGGVDEHFDWGSSSFEEMSSTKGASRIQVFVYAPKDAGSFGLVFVGDEFWVNRGSSRTRFEGPFRLSQPPSERPFYGVPAEDFFFAHDEQCLQNVAASNTFDGFSHWSIEQDFGHLSHYRLRYDRELSRSAYFFSSWRCGIDFFNLPPSEGVVPLIEFLATAIENEQCLPLVLYDF